MPGGIGELGRTSCVRTTPNPEVALRAVVAKGEAAVAKVYLEVWNGDRGLDINRARGPAFREIEGRAMLAGEAEQEGDEYIVRKTRKGSGHGAAS